VFKGWITMGKKELLVFLPVRKIKKHRR